MQKRVKIYFWKKVFCNLMQKNDNVHWDYSLVFFFSKTQLAKLIKLWHHKHFLITTTYKKKFSHSQTIYIIAVKVVVAKRGE